ncbi:MAG: DUF1178 family protein [Alphaproteobacteria bacterium]|nr:DUF1178 family protein [Alphaproteobacteria bacterium]
MILFDLHCASGHVFEAWFRDGAAYDEQVVCGQIACPHCASREIGKAPMAPAILSSAAERPGAAALSDTETGETMRLLQALKSEIETHFKDVGENLPEEARKIHYGEKEPENIRGQASFREVKSMWEEGISLLPLPIPAKKIN